MGKAPGRIFINYRRDDVVGVAGRLSDSLSRYFGDGRVCRDVDGIAAGANSRRCSSAPPRAPTR